MALMRWRQPIITRLSPHDGNRRFIMHGRRRGDGGYTSPVVVPSSLGLVLGEAWGGVDEAVFAGFSLPRGAGALTPGTIAGKTVTALGVERVNPNDLHLCFNGSGVYGDEAGEQLVIDGMPVQQFSVDGPGLDGVTALTWSSSEGRYEGLGDNLWRFWTERVGASVVLRVWSGYVDAPALTVTKGTSGGLAGFLAGEAGSLTPNPPNEALGRIGALGAVSFEPNNIFVSFTDETGAPATSGRQPRLNGRPVMAVQLGASLWDLARIEWNPTDQNYFGPVTPAGVHGRIAALADGAEFQVQTRIEFDAGGGALPVPDVPAKIWEAVLLVSVDLPGNFWGYWQGQGGGVSPNPLFGGDPFDWLMVDPADGFVRWKLDPSGQYPVGDQLARVIEFVLETQDAGDFTWNDAEEYGLPASEAVYAPLVARMTGGRRMRWRTRITELEDPPVEPPDPEFSQHDFTIGTNNTFWGWTSGLYGGMSPNFAPAWGFNQSYLRVRGNNNILEFGANQLNDENGETAASVVIRYPAGEMVVPWDDGSNRYSAQNAATSAFRAWCQANEGTTQPIEVRATNELVGPPPGFPDPPEVDPEPDP